MQVLHIINWSKHTVWFVALYIIVSPAHVDVEVKLLCQSVKVRPDMQGH